MTRGKSFDRVLIGKGFGVSGLKESTTLSKYWTRGAAFFGLDPVLIGGHVAVAYRGDDV